MFKGNVALGSLALSEKSIYLTYVLIYDVLYTYMDWLDLIGSFFSILIIQRINILLKFCKNGWIMDC